jgi:5-hydroxyisourate hydrolase
MSSPITTHVLDTARGCPAAGVPVLLETRYKVRSWRSLGRGSTDDNGRLSVTLPEDFQLTEGDYRLTFDAGAYFRASGVEGFYTEVIVGFVVRDVAAHYHVPLLLSPYGYTTYRGS